MLIQWWGYASINVVDSKSWSDFQRPEITLSGDDEKNKNEEEQDRLMFYLPKRDSEKYSWM